MSTNKNNKDKGGKKAFTKKVRDLYTKENVSEEEYKKTEKGKPGKKSSQSVSKGYKYKEGSVTKKDGKEVHRRSVWSLSNENPKEPGEEVKRYKTTGEIRGYGTGSTRLGGGVYGTGKEGVYEPKFKTKPQGTYTPEGSMGARGSYSQASDKPVKKELSKEQKKRLKKIKRQRK